MAKAPALPEPPDLMGPSYKDVLSISDLARYFYPVTHSEKCIYSMLREEGFPKPLRERRRGRLNTWQKRDINAWLLHRSWKP